MVLVGGCSVMFCFICYLLLDDEMGCNAMRSILIGWVCSSMDNSSYLLSWSSINYWELMDMKYSTALRPQFILLSKNAYRG